MAKRSYDKKPLYRRVNWRARGVFHPSGGEHRWSRNTKSEAAEIRDGVTARGMGGEKFHGLDFTPLFKFLLSRVGQDWDAVYSEAVSRLPPGAVNSRDEPIWWLVARRPEDRKVVVRVGESSLYSGLFINDDNVLCIVAPEISAEHISPYCPCCTHTFNGVQVTNPCVNPQFGVGDNDQPWQGYVAKENAS